MESALYGIYTLVVFVSEIFLVRCTHSFDFWYVNESCVNTVRQHFPWSILYFSCQKYLSLVRFAHSWEILSALEDEIRIPAQLRNILYLYNNIGVAICSHRQSLLSNLITLYWGCTHGGTETKT